MPDYARAIESGRLTRDVGRVADYRGLIVEAEGPPAYVGELCQISIAVSGATVPAEVVGFRGNRTLLMPFGDLRGIRAGSEVTATGSTPDVEVGPHLLGSVLDAFGRPLDGAAVPAGDGVESRPIYAEAMNPLDRAVIDELLPTGIRAIDTLLPLGVGQRVGVFAGPGVGKTSLLGMLTRYTSADVNVVAIVGERGREVRHFVERVITGEAWRRTVVVVATSDQPPVVRIHAAWTATAIAEYFRDRGDSVLLTVDSLTRFAVAQREIGLAVGEPPTAKGFTPSVFTSLPRLLERAGKRRARGAISGVYTVLTDGDGVDDPVAEHARAILDGHIVLSSDLANHGHYPAIDILRSASRLKEVLLDDGQKVCVRRALDVLAQIDRHRDAIELGTYRAGDNAELDAALSARASVEAFLRQPSDERVAPEKAFSDLAEATA